MMFLMWWWGALWVWGSDMGVGGDGFRRCRVEDVMSRMLLLRREGNKGCLRGLEMRRRCWGKGLRCRVEMEVDTWVQRLSDREHQA